MSIPGGGSPLLLGGAQQYTIQRSLRFNSSDSAYLSRTPASAGNRKTWTWSGWVKRSGLLATGDHTLFSSGTTLDNTLLAIGFRYDALLLADYASNRLATAQLFRDTSSWYHIVVAVDTTSAVANNRQKMYVNGNEVASFSERTNYSQNDDTGFGSTVIHQIGRSTYFGGNYFPGYLADIHFIDGQALTPSSFGETDINGIWQPKAYTGSYGTNGFQLKFADNSAATATTLGKDTSGNSNNWTPNNLSVTAGAGNDSLVDTPTNYGTDTGAGGEVRGNYATLNPIRVAAGLTLSNGNLDVTHGAASSDNAAVGTIGVSSGKWYWEFLVTASNGANVGIIAVNGRLSAPYLGATADSYAWYSNGSVSQKWTNNVGVTYGTPYAANDIVGVALDLDNGTLTYYRNGVSQGTAFTAISGTFVPASSGSSSLTASFTCNFGQRPFAYTAPSGFKALCDTNLPAPVVAKPSSAFDCVTYTGTGATLTPTSSLGFSPDLVWIKSRSAATDHTIYDAVRGTEARLESNNTDPEVTSDGGLTAFNSNGFTLGTLAQVNTNAATYVAWCWDEAVADGFDIVTYTGNGANRTIAHSLGVAPSFMIVKQRTAASATNWAVWHSSLANTEYLLLNSTAAKATGATYWNSTSPTSTNFSLGTAADVNTNNGTYVAYLWSSVAGYSSFGSYTGNGSTNGPFIYTGFRPRWVMIKHASGTIQGGTTYNWLIHDTTRNTYNESLNTLFPNSSAQENVNGALYGIDILSNGFKLRQQYYVMNDTGANYIYAAFAENPFQYARAR